MSEDKKKFEEAMAATMKAKTSSATQPIQETRIVREVHTAQERNRKLKKELDADIQRLESSDQFQRGEEQILFAKKQIAILNADFKHFNDFLEGKHYRQNYEELVTSSAALREQLLKHREHITQLKNEKTLLIEEMTISSGTLKTNQEKALQQILQLQAQQSQILKLTTNNDSLQSKLETSNSDHQKAIAALMSDNTNATDKISELAKAKGIQAASIRELEGDLIASANRLEEARASIRTLQVETHGQLETINNLRHDLGRSQETVRLNAETTQALESTMRDNDTEIAKLQKAMTSLKAQLQQKDEQIVEIHAEHTQQITRLQAKHEETSGIAKTEIERLKSETHQKTTENKTIEREVKRLADENTDLKDLLNRTKQSAKEERATLESEKTDTRELIVTLATKTATQTSEIEQLKYAVNSARSHLDTSQEEIHHLQLHIQKLEEAQVKHIHQAQANEAEAQAKITEIVRQAQVQGAENQARIQESMHEIEHLREAISGKEQELTEVRKQLHVNQENMKHDHRVAQENSAREIAQLQEQLRQVEQLANINSVAAADEAKRQAEEAQQNIATLTAQLEATQRALAAAQAAAGQQQQQAQAPQATPPAPSGANAAAAAAVVAAARERFKNR